MSVVIPTFNRVDQLGRCLAALTRQDAAKDSFEVIVVDDGSADGTPQLLASFPSPFRLRTVRQANAGQPVALNRGIKEATGSFCLFIDDDIEADPGLVRHHLRAQQEHGGVIALGMLRLRLTRGSTAFADHFSAWWRDHYERLASGALVPDFRACYSGNLSVPVNVLRRLGGFQEDLVRSFDVELAYRLWRDGLEIVFVREASAVQHYSKGFRAIVKDFDRMGEAAVAMLRRHPELVGYAPLGDFGQGTFKSLLLRRLLLRLHIPVSPLAVIDRLITPRLSAKLFALVQLHCFWRSVRKALGNRDEWRRLTRGTVVLMYHALGRGREPASRFIMPHRRFRHQLRWLKLRRYKVISLDEYVAARRENALPPPKTVVITFDDGYADNAELGMPVLERASIPAELFVVSGFIGEANRWDPGTLLDGRPLLTHGQLGKLVQSGISIGAHTVSHPRLTDIGIPNADHELRASRAELEGVIGASVRHFAYPYGKTSPEITELVRQAGYVTACGIEPGANGPAVSLYRLRRLEVAGTWSLPKFAMSLWLGHELRLRGRSR